MAGGNFGHSDQEIVEFKISGVIKKKVSRVSTQDFKTEYLKLFRKLLSNVPWESAFEGLVVHDCWSIFKNHLLKEKKQAIPLNLKTSKQSRRPAWLNREHLLEIMRKKKSHNLWKTGKVL